MDKFAADKENVAPREAKSSGKACKADASRNAPAHRQALGQIYVKPDGNASVGANGKALGKPRRQGKEPRAFGQPLMMR